MLVVGMVFIYLAVAKDWEPYELLPIGLGIIIANLPLTGMTDQPTATSGHQDAGIFGIVFHYGLSFWNLLPPIIFLGLGAMTDFGPVIANPKTLLPKQFGQSIFLVLHLDIQRELHYLSSPCSKLILIVR